MELLQRFKQYIQKENLFQPNDRLLLAVSGGIDSAVLCELCKQAGYDFVIAHCNFQLRGQESERDENFVRSLGEKYGVEIVVKKFDIAAYIELYKTGVQEAARNLRYQWFLEVCTDGTLGGRISNTKTDKPGWHFTIDYKKPRTFVVTAHHLNDSIETMLMNFFKGTGVKGLQGIQPKQDLQPYIIRPLLFARKEDLLSFANENELQFSEDSSNSSDKYTRNYFRNSLLPAIKKVYPKVEENLIGNLERFKEIGILYSQSIEQHKKKLVEKKGNEFHIPVLKLQKTEPIQTILYEIVKDFNFSSHQIGEVIALLQSETGKYIQSTTHRILKNRNWLIITPNQATEAQNILIEEGDKKISYKNGNLQIEKCTITNRQLQITNQVAQLNAAEIKFPLLLRKWKQGDYFYPLGMDKKKKLSRFFIDQKLSLIQKENVWVIEMDKKIIWVVGMRIDNRFKITDNTKEIISLTLKR